MTIKSIVDIPVNDQEFVRFQELFNRYTEQLAKTPSAWAKVSEEQRQVSSNFEKMTAALMAQSQVHREISAKMEEEARTSRDTGHIWLSLSHTAGGFAKAVGSAGEALLKWTGIASGALALIGGGGVFGAIHEITRMAGTAAGERRSAMGLGLSIGEQQAFGVNLGRFVEPGTFLAGIAEATADISKQAPLYALGVNPNGSTEDVALATLRRVRELVLSVPVNQLGILESQYNLGAIGLSVEDLRRLRTTSAEEYEAQMKHVGGDVGAMGLPPAVARKWQDFTTEMERAKKSIFATFVTGLAPLEEPLSKLTDAFKHFIEVMMKSDDVKKAIKAVADWMTKFDGTINTTQFFAEVKHFMSSVGDLAKIIDAVAHPVKTTEQKSKELWNWMTTGTTPSTPDEIMDFVNSEKPNFFGLFNPLTKQNYLGTLASDARVLGLPSDLLPLTWQLESSSRLAPPDSSRGAMGPFQLTKIALAQIKALTGLNINPRDPYEAAYGAGVYEKYLFGKFGGNREEVLAAYNEGEGKVAALVKQHPKDWQKYLLKETRGYLAKANAFMARPPGVTILVQNATGGSAAISVATLGAGP